MGFEGPQGFEPLHGATAYAIHGYRQEGEHYLLLPAAVDIPILHHRLPEWFIEGMEAG